MRFVLNTCFAGALVVMMPHAMGAQAKATDPIAAYKEFLAALGKATSLESLLPYYTKELSGGMRKMSKDMQANYLKMNKREIKDLKITKQNISGDKAEFEMTGKDASGQDLSGSATMVKEGGGWKVDDFAWIGPPPKG